MNWRAPRLITLFEVDSLRESRSIPAMSNGISYIITSHAALHHHLDRCVSSVIWQMQAQDELIILGDGYEPARGFRFDYFGKPNSQPPDQPGSSDQSSGAAGLGPDLRITMLPKAGISAARNFGLRHAKNEWVKFMDVDDLLAPFAGHSLGLAIDTTGKLNRDFACIVGGMNKVVNGQVVHWECRPKMDVIQLQNPFLISATLLHRDRCLAVGGFDERIEFEEDWDLWLKLYGHSYSFAVMQAVICYYCIDDQERGQKIRNHQVEGMDVRQYLRQKYNLPTPT